MVENLRTQWGAEAGHKSSSARGDANVTESRTWPWWGGVWFTESIQEQVFV
jgi:hypothetical protein